MEASRVAYKRLWVDEVTHQTSKTVSAVRDYGVA